jgi:hypothetical protein
MSCPCSNGTHSGLHVPTYFHCSLLSYGCCYLWSPLLSLRDLWASYYDTLHESFPKHDFYFQNNLKLQLSDIWNDFYKVPQEDLWTLSIKLTVLRCHIESITLTSRKLVMLMRTHTWPITILEKTSNSLIWWASTLIKSLEDKPWSLNTDQKMHRKFSDYRRNSSKWFIPLLLTRWQHENVYTLIIFIHKKWTYGKVTQAFCMLSSASRQSSSSYMMLRQD